MKLRYIILILLAITAINGIRAQKTDKQFVRNVEAERIAFFTQRMGITPAEAQKFWPIYNEYNKKKNAITAEKSSLTKFYKANSATMTENDVDVTIQKYVSLAKQETELLEDYNKKFRSVLPAHKVMKLYLAEFEFKEWLLKKIREKGD